MENVSTKFQKTRLFMSCEYFMRFWLFFTDEPLIEGVRFRRRGQFTSVMQLFACTTRAFVPGPCPRIGICAAMTFWGMAISVLAGARSAGAKPETNWRENHLDPVRLSRNRQARTGLGRP